MNKFFPPNNSNYLYLLFRLYASSMGQTIIVVSGMSPSRPAPLFRGSSVPLFPARFQRKDATIYLGNSAARWTGRFPRSSARPCLGSCAQQCLGNSASQCRVSSAGENVFSHDPIFCKLQKYDVNCITFAQDWALRSFPF